VQPFHLVDPTKPGVRKILVFFLVDPAEPVSSTATVTPQQMHWFKHAKQSPFHKAISEATPLIDDLKHIVHEYIAGQHHSTLSLQSSF